MASKQQPEENVNFDIKRNDNVGRYAVANKDLKPGETIFSEIPFAYGPKSDTYPVCLGCYTPVDCTNLCSSCGWPVCDTNCENIPAHKNAECQIFQKANVKFQPVEDASVPCPQMECITPLRVLLMKESNPKRWSEEVECMESHNEKRKQKAIWQYYQTNVVDFLRNKCQLGESFDENLIHTVCGILDVNAFEARTISGYLIRCLYPKLAILSHNCVSNISHSISTNGDGTNDDYRVTVRATINLKNGDELFSSYTYSLWPTIIRRSYLRETKYFDCNCKRCADPTELETHMSTLKCTKCDNGVVISSAPLDSEAIWKCTHCEFTTSSRAVKKAFETIQQEIDAIDEYEQDATALEAREQLFRKYRSVLHPRNAYNTILKYSLGQMYGKVPGYTLEDLPDILYERKAEMCQQVLDNLNIIEPGYTRIRAITLYELHVPLIFLARNQASTNTIDKDQLREKLNQVVKMLEESAAILELEPITSSEGMLGQVARQSLNQLVNNMEELIEGSFIE